MGKNFWHLCKFFWFRIVFLHNSCCITGNCLTAKQQDEIFYHFLSYSAPAFVQKGCSMCTEMRGQPVE